MEGAEREKENQTLISPSEDPQSLGDKDKGPHITYFLFSFDVFVLQGEEVQIGHLQLCLAGFKKTADVPVDTRTRSGVDHIGRERRTVSELLRGCSQRPPLWPPGKWRRERQMFLQLLSQSTHGHHWPVTLLYYSEL